MIMKLNRGAVVKPYVEFVRTLYPVGQGAFYTEVIKKENGSYFTVVYDCGTETDHSIIETQINEFKKVITKIDLLFISHFHKDHISGLDKLLDGVKVEKTVIPMLSEDVVTLIRAKNFLQNNKIEALSMDAIIKEFYINVETHRRFGKVIMVEPIDFSVFENDEDRSVCNTECVGNGSCISGFESLWEWVPFNSVSIKDQRAIDFMKGLRKIPGALDENGNLNASRIIRGCKTKVRSLYREVMRGANDNLYTMTVESRPSKLLAQNSDADVVREARCLYTGDLDSTKNEALWESFCTVYNYSAIGTVQIPHHGSRHNWRKEFLTGSPRRFFISAGTTNTYHHPDFWVIKDVFDANNCVAIITENAKTGREIKYGVISEEV